MFGFSRRDALFTIPDQVSVTRSVKTCLITSCVLVSALFTTKAKADPPAQAPRDLAMGGATRASATGTNAALKNPAGLTMARQFAIDPIYQFQASDRGHSIGLALSDSLNNQRFALGLTYFFARASPRLRYTNTDGARKTLELSRYRHEVAGVLGIVIIRNWLHIGAKPRFTYRSLRYLDANGKAINAIPHFRGFEMDAALNLNILDWVHLAFVGSNLINPQDPDQFPDRTLKLADNLEIDPETNLNQKNLSRVSYMPRTFSYGVAVYPLHHPRFSLNYDGIYDFTSYSNRDAVRLIMAFGGEFVLKNIPIRAGGYWDGRGPGNNDDRGYLSVGSGYVKSARTGGAGIDFAVSYSQQVSGPVDGPWLDSILSFQLGLRLHPDY